jgi:membrane protein YdbS with pleckstrin-like domain
MFNAFRHLCEQLLRIPPDPQPPPGDEASTRIYRAAVNYYKYLVAIWALTSLAVIVPVLIVEVAFITAGNLTEEFSLWWSLIPGFLLVIMVIVSLFQLAVVRLNYEKRWYIVTDRSLRVREGVVGVREMTITFANIQNISISQGPVQRLLKIADLRVDTAGGGAVTHAHHAQANLHTAWFRGVDNAPEVRELIQQRLRQLKDAGLGDHDDASDLSAISEAPADFVQALREVHAESEALRRTVSVASSS